MNKKLLIKYINSSVSSEQRREVVEWIKSSPRNEAYYIELKNSVVIEQSTAKTAGAELVSEEEKDRCYRNVLNGIKGNAVDDSDRNHSGQKVVLRRVLTAAAILLLIVSIGLNLYYFAGNGMGRGHSGQDRLADIQNTFSNSKAINTLYTERGLKGKVILPDSSVVWLNSDSKIEYPEEFDDDCRRVHFDGEGYFQVKKNSARPMVISTSKGMNLKVLGTSFHIKSYSNDDDEQTTLFLGKVEVFKVFIDQNRKVVSQTVKLEPLESISFADRNNDSKTTNQIISSSKKDTLSKVAWKNGDLLFDHTSMEEVVKMMERWYGGKIVVRDESIFNYKFSAVFSSESMTQVLDFIKFTMPIDYTISDNVVYLKKRDI